jgi:hypothetical protein
VCSRPSHQKKEYQLFKYIHILELLCPSLKFVQAILGPVIQKLTEAVRSSSHVRDFCQVFLPVIICPISQFPDEARAVAIIQLQTVSAVAKGLTRTSDSLFVVDEQLGDAERVAKARGDPRIIELQQGTFSAISGALDLWSTDASVSDVSAF